MYIRYNKGFVVKRLYYNAVFESTKHYIDL